MDNELRNTCGAAALSDTLRQIAIALIHLWLWNLNTTFVEFTFLPRDIEMRADVEPVVGKKIKVKLWLEPDD